MRTINANEQADINYGETVTYTDAEHGRTIEIERDEFDGVFRVVIKHDPENRALWYAFDTDNEVRLDRYLESKGFAGLKHAATERM